jgi:hypothetical protein
VKHLVAVEVTLLTMMGMYSVLVGYVSHLSSVRWLLMMSVMHWAGQGNSGSPGKAGQEYHKKHHPL